MNPKKYILLVDDDPLLSRLYETTLKGANYEVSTVSSGEVAISEINKKKPDLVLLDIMMPKMSGVDVLRKIKEDKTNETIRVVILTNLSHSTEEAKAVQKLGISDYLIKSETSLKELVNKVVSAIEK